MHPGNTGKKGHLRSIAKAGQCWKAGPPKPLPRGFWGSRHYLTSPSARFSPFHRCKSSAICQALLVITKAFTLLTFKKGSKKYKMR